MVQKKTSKVIQKAKKAQVKLEKYNQKEIDSLCAHIAWKVLKEENSRHISRLAVEEAQMGNASDKHQKIQKKVRGAWRDIKGMKTIGKIEENKKLGIIKYAKPAGVIASLIPCTNPEATPPINALFAIKGRNSIIFSPHPRTRQTTFEVVKLMREALAEQGGPVDSIQCFETPTIELSKELMAEADLVVATGGGAMVKAAYTSGTPAYGVGPGNACVIIDETADLRDAAKKIRQSKTFDYATSCSAENSLIIEESIFENMLAALQGEGGYLLTSKEKDKLEKKLWENGTINNKLIARPAFHIAEEAGLEIGDKSFFIVEEEGIGPEHPFSGEKLSVILTVFKYSGFDNALHLLNKIISYQGLGHSCGIHSYNEKNIEALGQVAKTSRIMVRQPQCYANSGDWTNGMPFSLSLGCGTWGGNITTENIHMKHFLNITWLSQPIDPIILSDKELFGGLIEEIGE